MERWLGRVALVTGASSGIGAATAFSLAKHGMNVIGCSRHPESIQVSGQLVTGETLQFALLEFILLSFEPVKVSVLKVRSIFGGKVVDGAWIYF